MDAYSKICEAEKQKYLREKETVSRQSRSKAKADAEPEKGGVVCVGKYRLWKLADDALLIEHESGERIEVSEREIERFYNSRF